MEYAFAPLRRFADFSGRSRRTEFWSWCTFVVVAGLMMAYLDSVLGLGGKTSSYAEGGSVGFSISGGLLSVLFLLAVLVPHLAVAVRRLHDIGKSGWLNLFGLIPLFGWIYLIYLFVQPGMAGPNLYGADPKGGDQGKVFA